MTNIWTCQGYINQHFFTFSHTGTGDTENDCLEENNKPKGLNKFPSRQKVDIDVASIEPIESFLSHSIDYDKIEEEGYQCRKWVTRHDDAFAGIFMARTGIYIQGFH